MLKIGDKVVMNRDGDFSDKDMTTNYSWWGDMENLGVLTVSDIGDEDIDGNYAIDFFETNYRALNTWVEKVN